MKKLLLCLLLLALPVLSQTIVRIDPTPVQTVSSNVPPGAFPPVLAVPGATINFCAFPASPSVGACTNFAATFSDSTGSQQCPANAQVVLAGTNACVTNADSQGAFGFWVTAGANYAYTVTLPSGRVYGPFPITAGTGGGGSSGNYNQGSANAVTQTVTAKLQQYLSFDDFGATPTNSASVNLTAIQNAINYASPLGIIRTCQGTYNINGTLAIPNTMNIHGHGATQTASGCVIKETAAVPVFQEQAVIVTHTLTLEEIEIDGGTYGLDVSGTDGGHVALLGNIRMVRTTWKGQTIANVHLNPWGAIQTWFSRNNYFGSTGQVGTYNVLQENASGGSGFVVVWDSDTDYFTSTDYPIYMDSGGNTSDCVFVNPRFVAFRKNMVTLLGSHAHHVFIGGNAEQSQMDDPATIVHTTGTTSGTSQTTITVADAAHFAVGQPLTIQRGAPTQGPGTWPGFDITVHIVSCSPSCPNTGSTVITVDNAIPLQVTSTDVFNAQYDGIALLRSPVTNVAPASIALHNTDFFVKGRYYVNSTASSFSLDGYNGSTIVYDPLANGTIYGYIFNSANSVPVYRTAIAENAGNNLPFRVRQWTGDTQSPTIWSANPGTNGGALFVACGDNLLANGCGYSGNYGEWDWMANSGSLGKGLRWKPGNNYWIFSTGLTNTTNILVGGTGIVDSATVNGLTLGNGVVPSAGTSGQGTANSVSGQLWWTDSSGTSTQLTGLPNNAPKVVNLTNQTAALSSSVGSYNVDRRCRVSFYGKVTTPAGSSSVLGSQFGSAARIQFTDAADSTTPTVTVPLFLQDGTLTPPSTGNTGNTTTSTVQGSIFINVKASTIIFYTFPYTSVGSPVMAYEFMMVVEPTDVY